VGRGVCHFAFFHHFAGVESFSQAALRAASLALAVVFQRGFCRADHNRLAALAASAAAVRRHAGGAGLGRASFPDAVVGSRSRDRQARAKHPGLHGLYTPIDADGYEINREARRVTFQGQGADQIHVLEWGPETKFFTAQVGSSGQLLLRLFNYPAWRVEVNGRVVPAVSLDLNGQITIPVDAGENQVRIIFSRTRDRMIGGVVSGVSGLLLVGLETFRRKRRPLPKAA
jgi:hypothetical protein